jgi:hypothetical protein
MRPKRHFPELTVPADYCYTSTLVTIIQRVIAADSYHKTRLHDEKGNMLPAVAFADMPIAAYHTILAALGRRPVLPWFTYPAVRKIERLLCPDWLAVEFGSGMSTCWLARRVAGLHSIESDAGWYRRVKPMLPSNVVYELRSGPDYSDLSAYQNEHFDFAVVDGQHRGDCMRSVLPKMKRGGYVYYDNSDKDMTLGSEAQGRVAERLLIERAKSLNYIRGFTVCRMSAHEGILAVV